MRDQFILDVRLGIRLPNLKQAWEDYTNEERASILLEWEEIRARIPDRIKDLEFIINRKQRELSLEESFPRSCQLNSEIAEHASIINDLHIWFRVQQDYRSKTHQ